MKVQRKKSQTVANPKKGVEFGRKGSLSALGSPPRDINIQDLDQQSMGMVYDSSDELTPSEPDDGMTASER